MSHLGRLRGEKCKRANERSTPPGRSEVVGLVDRSRPEYVYTGCVSEGEEGRGRKGQPLKGGTEERVRVSG